MWNEASPEDRYGLSRAFSPAIAWARVSARLRWERWANTQLVGAAGEVFLFVRTRLMQHLDNLLGIRATILDQEARFGTLLLGDFADSDSDVEM